MSSTYLTKNRILKLVVYNSLLLVLYLLKLIQGSRSLDYLTIFRIESATQSVCVSSEQRDIANLFLHDGVVVNQLLILD